ncbi:MAG: hypothetical protein AAF092_00015 [Pseudomonadota bacterium]
MTATVLSMSVASTSLAATVTLTNATATFSQAGFSVAGASNGTTTGNDGWGIQEAGSGDTNAQTAVWETAADFTADTLNFQLHHDFAPFTNPEHLLGNFRLSVTSDDRSLFADGLTSGGDVTANWTVLTGATAVSSAGTQTLTTQGDGSILAGGATPATATYSVTYTGFFANITGIRLEALPNASLPTAGPGLKPINGNFVLTEITLDQSIAAVPLPAGGALLLAGLVGMVGLQRRRLKAA